MIKQFIIDLFSHTIMVTIMFCNKVTTFGKWSLALG